MLLDGQGGVLVCEVVNYYCMYVYCATCTPVPTSQEVKTIRGLGGATSSQRVVQHVTQHQLNLPRTLIHHLSDDGPRVLTIDGDAAPRVSLLLAVLSIYVVMSNKYGMHNMSTLPPPPPPACLCAMVEVAETCEKCSYNNMLSQVHFIEQ